MNTTWLNAKLRGCRKIDNWGGVKEGNQLFSLYAEHEYMHITSPLPYSYSQSVIKNSRFQKNAENEYMDITPPPPLQLSNILGP